MKTYLFILKKANSLFCFFNKEQSTEKGQNIYLRAQLFSIKYHLHKKIVKDRCSVHQRDFISLLLLDLIPFQRRLV